MANISKIKRDRMIAFLNELKKTHGDDASIGAFNEIENFLNEKKFGLVWEEHTEQVDEMLESNIPVLCEDPERRLCKDESLPWNFIIEGDNLQALYLLEKTHKGKVDCIYIDPPYNTGAKDWKYNNDYVDGNDVYRHSKWLSMMNVRLQTAKKLLNPENSVLICTIDEKEYTRLGCLLEELFPTSSIQMITNIINRHGSNRLNLFTRCEEYIFFVFIGTASVRSIGRSMIKDEDEKRDDNNVVWKSLCRTAANNGLRTDRPNLFYPIIFESKTGMFLRLGDSLPVSLPRTNYVLEEGETAVWPLAKDGTELRWALQQNTLKDRIERGFVKFGKWDGKKCSVSYITSGLVEKCISGEIEVIGYDEKGTAVLVNKTRKNISPFTLWNQYSHDAGTYGTTLIYNILCSRRFSFPKSLYAVKDSLAFATIDNPNAIIVDFFAGSGTTLHAVNLMNAEDGGNRRCIMVTNNEVSVEEAKKLTQQGYKPGDPEWEALGIAKYVTWPRSVCSIEGKDINGNPLKGEYITLSGKKINMSDGFTANVKYFKCDWTPRKPEDYLLSNALCLHIKEMIELQTAQEVDGEKNVLILNRDDFNKHILNTEAFKKIENIWLNQNMVLSVEEMRLLAQKSFKYIPREYFGQELREAAE